VPNGEEAVEFLREHAVDLVILDMIMEPGIDGYETFRRIKAIRPEQKAIIASGYSETGRVKQTLALGAGCYIKKPYTISTIGKRIKEELNAH
jgi:CheY-like chemotaxis protein